MKTTGTTVTTVTDKEDLISVTNENAEVGSLIRKRYGKSVARVVSRTTYQRMNKVTYSGFKVEYLESKRVEFCDAQYSNWVFVETNIHYKHKDSPNLLSLKMKLSEQQWLMVDTITNTNLLVVPSELEVVTPYTIKLSIAGKEEHQLSKKDHSYKVGDCFLLGKTLTIVRVLELDTKCNSASRTFKPWAKLEVNSNF